jgi:hypothetical protein
MPDAARNRRWPPGEGEAGVWRVRVGKTPGPKDVETEQYLHVSHRPELSRGDSPADVARCRVEEVVVVLNESAAAFSSAADQHFEFLERFLERHSGAFLHDDMGPGI